MSLDPDDDRGAFSYDGLVRASGLPRLEARALLEKATGRSRTALIARGDETAPAGEARAFEQLAAARRDGEPLAYLIGAREFLGRSFAVTPATLIPRPETEHLVEIAVGLVASVAAPRLIDLGTGSGIVAISLALARPDAAVWATDLDPAAIAVAGRNAATHGATVRFAIGDWWQAVGDDSAAPVDGFDLVASNPPYIRADDPHLGEGDLRHEPRDALTPGPSGTEAIERILAGLARWLNPGGWVAFEHGHDQGAAVRALVARAGFEAIRTEPDLAGLDRITVGRRPADGLSR